MQSLRYATYECICGDPAFKAFVEQELAAQRAAGGAVMNFQSSLSAGADLKASTREAGKGGRPVSPNRPFAERSPIESGIAVKCVLFGRDGKRVTDTVVRMNIFLAASDNPFPCSKLLSAVSAKWGAEFLYQVMEAEENGEEF